MSSNNDKQPQVLPPIVFVHGFKGSVLIDKDSGEEIFTYDNKLWQFVSGCGGGGIADLPMEWENNDGMNEIDNTNNRNNNTNNNNNNIKRQLRDNLVPGQISYNVKAFSGCCVIRRFYGPLIKHLEKSGREVHLFLYDWRRELDETSQKLERFLEKDFGPPTKTKQKMKPQVIAHSLGCLITLHCYVRRHDLFHSVLWGAGAMGPSICRLDDFSIYGGIGNRIVNNSQIFTPASNLSNPSGMHFFPMLPGEREMYFGTDHKELDPTSLLYEKASGKPILDDLGFRTLNAWKKYKVGMYHPKSRVEVTPEKEAWMQSVLDRVYKFRSGLYLQQDATMSSATADRLPPTAVLNSNGLPTKWAFYLLSDGTIDLTGPSYQTLPGDGAVSYRDSVPPVGIPVIQTITTKGEHTQVLNDGKNVDKLLSALINEVQARERRS